MSEKSDSGFSSANPVLCKGDCTATKIIAKGKPAAGTLLPNRRNARERARLGSSTKRREILSERVDRERYKRPKEVNRERPTPHSRRRVTARGPPHAPAPQNWPSLVDSQNLRNKLYPGGTTKTPPTETRRPPWPGRAHTPDPERTRAQKQFKKKTGNGRSRHTPSSATPLAILTLLN